jgi:lysozyme
MNMSDAGLKLLMLREGSRNKAYKDTKGIWTIGVGHTGPEVVQGLVWTDAQVLEALRKDIAITEKALNDTVVVLLGQQQVDALCSFIFNVGVNAFRRSTMLRFINQGKMREAAAEFDKWHIPPEITSRRNSEKSQFQGT